MRGQVRLRAPAAANQAIEVNIAAAGEQHDGVLDEFGAILLQALLLERLEVGQVGAGALQPQPYTVFDGLHEECSYWRSTCIGTAFHLPLGVGYTSRGIVGRPANRVR